VHNHLRLYRRMPSVGILLRVAKYLLHMSQSSTSVQTDTVRQYFTESCKIFTAHATITDVCTDGYSPSVFYLELQNIYCTCHNHWRLYKRIQSVGISQRAGLLDSMSVQFTITDGLCKFQSAILMHLWPRVYTDGRWKF
jgi:hypothetical protein